MRHSDRTRAILAAVAAGAIWGVSFLAPRALSETSAGNIALFRFLFFGISSAVALAYRRNKRPRVDTGAALQACGLALAGYSLYYTWLAVGVKGIGVPFATAIIALLPLTILLVSTPAREWSRLGFSIALVAAGGVLIPLELFSAAYELFLERSVFDRAVGLGATLGALALWTLFATRNARFLRAPPAWRPLDWAGVLGVASAATSILFFALSLLGGDSSARVSELIAAGTDIRVLLWTAFMGIAGAWLTSGLWNYASRILPPATAGMLLVSESVFGFAFSFLYDSRLPTIRESLAAAALIGGAVLGVRALGRSAQPDR